MPDQTIRRCCPVLLVLSAKLANIKKSFSIAGMICIGFVGGHNPRSCRFRCLTPEKKENGGGRGVRGCTDPFLLRAMQSIILRKAFQFQVCTCTLYCIWGRTHRSGRFRWLNKKTKKVGGRAARTFFGRSSVDPSRRPFLGSLSLPGVFFCWIETTHRLMELNCWDLLHTQNIPLLNRTVILCHHSRTGPLHPGMHAARTLHLESRRIENKERKRIMHKLKAANCTVSHSLLTKSTRCCPESDLLSWVGDPPPPPTK